MPRPTQVLGEVIASSGNFPYATNYDPYGDPIEGYLGHEINLGYTDGSTLSAFAFDLPPLRVLRAFVVHLFSEIEPAAASKNLLMAAATAR